MALKPTIFKARVALSDLNRNYYDTLNLTLAQHPSETVERMMVRLLAFCLNAEEGLTFTRGLSTSDEPDITLRNPDDSLAQWIEVGEPTPERIKKATRIANAVKVYSFNAKSPVWWEQNKKKFAALDAAIYQIPWTEAQALAELTQRAMNVSVTISEATAYFSLAVGTCEVTWISL